MTPLTHTVTRRLRQDLATWFTTHDHALDYLTVTPGTYLIDDGLGDLRPTDGILYTFVTTDQCEYRVTVPAHVIDHALSTSADAAVDVITTAFLAKFGTVPPAPTPAAPEGHEFITYMSGHACGCGERFSSQRAWADHLGETLLELPDPDDLDTDYTTRATHVIGYGVDDHLGEYTDKATLRRIPGTTPAESATFITLLIVALCIIAMITLAAATH